MGHDAETLPEWDSLPPAQQTLGRPRVGPEAVSMRPLQPLGLGTGVGGARSPGAPGRTQRCARGVPHPAGCVLPAPRPGGRAGARPLRVSPRLCCCSQDSGLPALISSLHRSHLVMPEPQSRCEFQRGSVELGLGAAGEERGVGTAAAQPEDSCPCSPRLCAAPCTPPPPAALAGGQEEAGGGGQLSPGAPCDGNCVNPGQPGRRGAEAVAPLWLLLGWARRG